jgi:hypothetical protein
VKLDGVLKSQVEVVDLIGSNGSLSYSQVGNKLSASAYSNLANSADFLMESAPETAASVSESSLSIFVGGN